MWTYGGSFPLKHPARYHSSLSSPEPDILGYKVHVAIRLHVQALAIGAAEMALLPPGGGGLQVFGGVPVEKLTGGSLTPTSQSQGETTVNQPANAMTAPGSTPAVEPTSPDPNRLDIEAEGDPVPVGNPGRKGESGTGSNGARPDAWQLVTGRTWR